MTTESQVQPEVFTDLTSVQVAAERSLPADYRDFVGNADVDGTLLDDLASWRALRLRPRALVDVSRVDTSTTLLGHRVSMPILAAPYIGSTMVHPDGEVAVARGAVAAGTVITLSMNATRTPEQVGPEAPGRYWQQLYWKRDRGIVADVVARAVAAGASALCLTVDLPVLPVFAGRMRRAATALGGAWTSKEHGMFSVHDYLDRPPGAAFPDASPTWADLEWLRGLSELPLILKGIIRAEDAVLAREHGAEAVIVSNHAGQALRDSQPVAEALPSVVDAVGGDLEVYADSGIRSGADALKALALGARAVLVGRPVLWGLALRGAEGVQRVLSLLRDELEEVMAITGAPTVADIDRSVLAPPRAWR